MGITQSINFNANPAKVYSALTSSSEFARFTGASAEIELSEGGLFSCFGGQITGRHLVLIPDQLIIQAWRADPWDEHVYSIVRFSINEAGTGSAIDMEHRAYPEGEQEHLEGGWKKMYWDQLRTYLDSPSQS